MLVCKHQKVILCVSSTCLASFSLVWPIVVFNMSISMSCLRPCFGDVEGSCMSCVRYVNIYTIALTHDVVSTVVQVLSWSSEGLSEVSHLCFSPLDSPTVSHTKHMLYCGLRCLVVKSCWVCVRKVMYTQVHLPTHLAIFSKNLSTGPPSISWTSIQLLYAFSALSDQALFPKIVENLRLASKLSTLCNSGINSADCHLE